MRHPTIRPDWLARNAEPALEPDLPIVDAHHHLWDRPGDPYMLNEFLADASGGHAVQASVFIECNTSYRPDGDPLFRPLGRPNSWRLPQPVLRRNRTGRASRMASLASRT
ncbi:hypothetical protein ACFQU7_29560 [Pseudoroseomonas wenyumeiae]